MGTAPELAITSLATVAMASSVLRSSLAVIDRRFLLTLSDAWSHHTVVRRSSWEDEGTPSCKDLEALQIGTLTN